MDDPAPIKHCEVPKYGFKVSLDHIYTEKWTQGILLSFRRIMAIIPLILRYLWDYVKRKLTGMTVPVMDYVNVVQSKHIYGVPIGGIGAGSIGRGYRGEFCRYQLKPGIYEYNTVDANQFIITIKDNSGSTIFQSLLSTFKKTSRNLKLWKSNIDASKCYYTGLYPRAWTEYDLSEYGIKLVCRQINPIIPHNYKDSSMPCAVFVWTVKNVCNEKRIVTVAFTFKNGTSNISKKTTIQASRSFTYMDSTGVVLDNTIADVPCTFVLASTSDPEKVEVSKCLYFDPTSNGELVWNQLRDNGCFNKLNSNEYRDKVKDMGCGIACQTVLESGTTRDIEMCLAWDMPFIKFPAAIKPSYKFYTKYFGCENASLKLVNYALKNYREWERKIYEWQEPVLSDPDLPDWYKSALFNETYFVSDGGTIWLTLSHIEAAKISVSDPRQKYGRFAYLEGHEYRMYNTYDVHFYASFALAINWPYLQLSLQWDLKDFIALEIPQLTEMLYSGHFCERKYKNSVPHDVGNPNENPFLLVNSYPIHDVSDWKDLNVKFVLQVLRDYRVMEEHVETTIRKQYLEEMYDTCKIVMTKTLKFDEDGDDLIENSGYPDQTFDSWVMTGSSAYCGGLWLAALFAMIEIGKTLENKPDDVKNYEHLLKNAKNAFETKLWNGKYYNFDCSTDASSVMADQLCGHWYLRACGYFYEVFKKEHVLSCLNTIYQNNVLSYNGGSQGAVNGYLIDKGADGQSLQSDEVWTGVTYGLAGCMIHEGMFSSAWKTAGGIYNTMWMRAGLAYETPEAFSAGKFYRSVGYMRPLSIWSMHLAWKCSKK